MTTGRGDALLQLAHLISQGGLVTHSRRHPAEQRRHLGTGLREAEDVVDEEQHVLAFFIAEVLGDGEAGETHAEARSGRLGHLAVDQRDFALAEIFGIDDAAFLHFEPEVVAFASALANTGEHGESAVLQCNVVDELHDDDRLAYASAAE